MRQQADRKITDLSYLINLGPKEREHVRAALACAFAAGTTELFAIQGGPLAAYLEEISVKVAGLR